MFDATAALLGLRSEALYEGQPAVELEAVADESVTDVYYPFDVIREGDGWVVDPAAALGPSGATTGPAGPSRP